MKNILLIDGGYYQNIWRVTGYQIQDILFDYFGKLFQPDKIIYFSANIFTDEMKKEFADIKNLEFNLKGYMDNNSHQKAVDGYIVAELVDLSYEDDAVITLVSGDGDMKAGVERVFKRTNRKVNILGTEGTVSKELEEFCEIYYFPKLEGMTVEDFTKPITIYFGNDIEEENEDKVEEKVNNQYLKYLNETNINILKKMENSLRTTLTPILIGQKGKEFGFKYPKGKLYDLLVEIEKAGYIKIIKNAGIVSSYSIEIL